MGNHPSQLKQRSAILWRQSRTVEHLPGSFPQPATGISCSRRVALKSLGLELRGKWRAAPHLFICYACLSPGSNKGNLALGPSLSLKLVNRLLWGRLGYAIPTSTFCPGRSRCARPGPLRSHRSTTTWCVPLDHVQRQVSRKPANVCGPLFGKHLPILWQTPSK